MYTKEELESMEITQLMGIAADYGIKVSQDDELSTVVYAILDKAAEQSAAGIAPKKKRTRIVKKDTDRVYTVNGKEGENFDVKSRGIKTAEAPSLFNDIDMAPDSAEKPTEKNAEPVEEPKVEAPTPAPKKRGRKSKAELAAIAAAEEAKKAEGQQEAESETAIKPEGEEETVPKQKTKAAKQSKAKKQKIETKTADEETSDSGTAAETLETEELVAEREKAIPEANFMSESFDTDDRGLLEQLQEKMAQHNREGEQSIPNEIIPDGVWAGDPGDGTDFITVVDIPIEDQGALPTLDMFDRPIVQQAQEPQPIVTQVNNGGSQSKYDFGDMITGSGVLELMQDGYGFLRSSDYNYLSSPDDIYVSQQQIKKWSLKTGDVVECTVRPPHDNEKYFALSDINSINGRNPNEVRDRVSFEHLTPLFPDEKFTLCGDSQTTNPSVRIVDLFSPIGKGQRALIVAQPKTGKTILMKDIANAIAANHPEAYIMMLLIDERPEEVTDMARTVDAEVIASTFDEPADRHVKIAGIVLEKAKRMVECGHDVVIFLDSITRLARAYNTVAPASGKVLTGGVDANALQKPKRFFGAARNIEGGGSLTIIATALVDTGSKMDEVIFEEFKGTGNSEIQLNRALSNKRIFPAIDLVQSSTRRDDLLQDQTTLNRMWIVRKFIAEMNPIEAMNTIRDRLVQSRNNAEFLMSMNG
jgi:transcription termination factor Rho